MRTYSAIFELENNSVLSVFGQQINITGKLFPHLQTEWKWISLSFPKKERHLKSNFHNPNNISKQYERALCCLVVGCSAAESLPSPAEGSSAIQLEVSFGIYEKLFKYNIFLCIRLSMEKLVVSCTLCKCQ